MKSQNSAVDVIVLRTLHGSMHTLLADQALLVSWGGFTKAVHKEAKQSYFSVRLWLRPPEIQTELPLKRVWTLVIGETGE